MPGKSFEFIEWKNGRTILRGSLHRAPGKNAPFFILCHGFTGHRLGPGYLFVRLSRELAKAGVSSLRFDFAGSGESDGAFHDMTAATMQSDLLSAVRFVKKKFSPQAVVLLGHSLGGMIAALCSVPCKPAGLALLAPVGEPRGLARRRAAVIEAGPNSRGYYENGPHEIAPVFLETIEKLDPVETMTRRFRGKLLLIQGDADASIAVAESGRYVHAARRAGIGTEYYILKNADHNFSTVSHFETVCATLVAWAQEHFR